MTLNHRSRQPIFMLSVQLPFHKMLREGIIITLVLLPAVGFLAAVPQWQLDRLIYDKLMPLVSPPMDPRIMLITIDDASISAIGRWPWSRDFHSLLLERLAPLTPKAVLYDLIFTERDPSPEIDRRLGAAMAKVGRVVVPTLREAEPAPGQAPRYLSPIKPVAEGAKAIGHIYVRAGVDSVVRQVYLKEGNANGQLNQLAWEAYAATFTADQQPKLPDRCCARSQGGSWFAWNEVLIPFGENHSQVPAVSFISVLNGEVPDELLRNRIILVGVTASGLGDRYPTPISVSGGATPGVVVNAHLLNGLLHQQLITPTPMWVNISQSILSVLIVLTLFSTFRLRNTFLVCLGLVIVHLTLSLVLLVLGWWSPPGASLVGILAAYMFWSWRRLNALVVFFGVELDRMKHELKEQPAQSESVFRGDKLVGRALALDSMIEHMHSSRRFIAQCLDSLPSAIFVTDLQGKVLLVNLSAVALEGNGSDNPQSLVGRNIFQILRSIDSTTDPSAPLRMSAWAPGEISLERLAGQFIHTLSERSFKIQLASLDTESGEPKGWLVGLLEFTVERLAQEQRDCMLRFLSHDLRAPQSAILALLEMQELVKEPMSVDELRRHIEQQVRRTLGLADSFMLLEEAKSKPVTFEPLFIGAIVLDAIDQVWPLAQHKGIRIEHLFIDDETCVTNGSRELLTRAIFNLLENAVKYSPSDTIAHIELMRKDTEIVLTLRDEGRGIGEEDLPHLFDEFRQFGTGNQRGDGYGLGMAFVSKIMQRHDARIACASQIDVGTTFTLVFQAI
nr:CHASE2 domain-containing protein [Pseudomonas sp. GGS8]